MSLREIAARVLDLAVLNAYGLLTAEEKITLLENNPVPSPIKAIQNDYTFTHLADPRAGARNPAAIRLLAKSL